MRNFHLEFNNPTQELGSNSFTTHSLVHKEPKFQSPFAAPNSRPTPAQAHHERLWKIDATLRCNRNMVKAKSFSQSPTTSF